MPYISAGLRYHQYKESQEFLRKDMNLAKVSANGQVTVTVEIRRKLNLKEGDKIVFFERSNGEVVINNAEDDVQRLIDKERYGERNRIC
ncbi:MAG: type II toxin-antitoxin system PrlF family antitoxin [Treponema sp.]|jgi:AbrB family looped-hinge helix DNA binding protein|nr:type II toxin-antitoxin system PrlF family antitoxin [Treponema sp.]